MAITIQVHEANYQFHQTYLVPLINVPAMPTFIIQSTVCNVHRPLNSLIEMGAKNKGAIKLTKMVITSQYARYKVQSTKVRETQTCKISLYLHHPNFRLNYFTPKNE